MLLIILASLGLGLFSGLLAGLFGIGGGLVIVPVLILLYTHQGFPQDLIMLMAIATSLAAIIITSIASVYNHHRLGSVSWQKIASLTPGIVAGTILGSLVADFIPADILRNIYITYLLCVGIDMARATVPQSRFSNPSSKPVDFFAAIIIGLVSALVGIGGGTLTVPYLVHSHYPMRNAVAIASGCGLPIALAGAASYVALGLNTPHLPEWSLGYIYLPSFLAVGLGSVFTAPIGAKLAHRLPARQLKRYFSVLIFLMVVKLVWY